MEGHLKIQLKTLKNFFLYEYKPQMLHKTCLFLDFENIDYALDTRHVKIDTKISRTDIN